MYQGNLEDTMKLLEAQLPFMKKQFPFSFNIDGKVIPHREDLEETEKDSPNATDADKFRTAQARRGRNIGRAIHRYRCRDGTGRFEDSRH
jgi:hypothetical protein